MKTPKQNAVWQTRVWNNVQKRWQELEALYSLKELWAKKVREADSSLIKGCYSRKNNASK